VRSKAIRRMTASRSFLLWLLVSPERVVFPVRLCLEEGNLSIKLDEEVGAIP